MAGINDFKGKNALVTGGANGIGAALVDALVASGARVFIADINAEKLAETAKRLGCESAACDVSDEAAVEELVESAWAALGPIDLLCANAGVIVPGSLLEIETAHWWRPTAANFFDRVAKARTLEALDAAGGPELVSRYAGSKKAELASAAERIFSGNFIGEADVKTRAEAWVPEFMRFGSPEEPVEDEAADPADDEVAHEIAEQAA